MRDCENCIYSGKDGCVKWECEFVSKEEARLVVAEKKELTADGDCISRKSVIQLTREMISAEEYGLMDLLDEVKKLPTIPQFLCDQDCEHCLFTECPMTTEKSTIPQTDLTYDMVEQYAKENGFVIWTKEQTEDTLRKLLNYMDTEKQTNTAEWITYPYNEVKCSNCDYDLWGNLISAKDEFKYCPNCGKLMQKGENE